MEREIFAKHERADRCKDFPAKFTDRNVGSCSCIPEVTFVNLNSG
jgi:hypothetical protein